MVWHDKHGRPELMVNMDIVRRGVAWSPEEDAADVTAAEEDPGQGDAGDTAGKDQAGDDRGAVPRR